MSDIVERLMRFAGKVCLSTDTEVEAADEIERLRTENAKFREAELIFSKDGQKWRTAISIFKEQDAKIDKLENIIEDDAKLILRVRMENEKLRAALAFYADDKNWRLNGPLDTNSGNFTGGLAQEIVER